MAPHFWGNIRTISVQERGVTLTSNGLDEYLNDLSIQA